MFKAVVTTLGLVAIVCSSAAHEALFEEQFKNELQPGWSWLREEKGAWKIQAGELRIKVQPGNMWGPENSGKNVLVRAVPEGRDLEISVKVGNRPTHQYEQVDLVWYYDDSHQVKIGQELVDGQLSIVMGREEGDRTRTIAIIPIKAEQVEVRFVTKGDIVYGYYREDPNGEWKKAGDCTMPKNGSPKIALQCYQGPPDAEHWGRIDDFVIRAAE